MTVLFSGVQVYVCWFCRAKCRFSPPGSPADSRPGTTARPAPPVTLADSVGGAAAATNRCTGETADSEEVSHGFTSTFRVFNK